MELSLSTSHRVCEKVYTGAMWDAVHCARCEFAATPQLCEAHVRSGAVNDSSAATRREEVTMHQSTKLLSALTMCLACISLAPVVAQQVGAPSGAGPYPAIAESRTELPRHTVMAASGHGALLHAPRSERRPLRSSLPVNGRQGRKLSRFLNSMVMASFTLFALLGLS